MTITEEYKIEKNVPLPKRAEGYKPKYPFSDMKVGDSFAFPPESFQSVANSAGFYMKRTQTEFVWRKDNLRCWRTK